MQTETRRRRWIVGYIPPRPEPRADDDGDETLDIAVPLTAIERAHHALGAGEEWVLARVVEATQGDWRRIVRLIEQPQLASAACEGDTVDTIRTPRGWWMVRVIARAPRWSERFVEAHPEVVACIICGQPGRVEPGCWWEARCDDHSAPEMEEEE